MVNINISVITVVLNGKNYIKECLENFSKQSYKYKEHIIVDGGSTDGTIDIIKEWSKVNNKNITFIILEKSGIYDAINAGVDISSGDVIGLLHVGDYYPNTKVLEHISVCFLKNKNLECYFGGALLIDKVKKIKLKFYHSLFFYKWMLLFGVMPAHTASYFRTHVLKNNKYNNQFTSSGDFDFFLRIFRRKLLILNEYKCLVIMRSGGKSTNGIISYANTIKEQFISLKKNGCFPFLLLFKYPLKYLLYTVIPIFFKYEDNSNW
jgi:glycosyltransferase involved in cell wall biosynthesis